MPQLAAPPLSRYSTRQPSQRCSTARFPRVGKSIHTSTTSPRRYANQRRRPDRVRRARFRTRPSSVRQAGTRASECRPCDQSPSRPVDRQRCRTRLGTSQGARARIVGTAVYLLAPAPGTVTRSARVPAARGCAREAFRGPEVRAAGTAQAQVRLPRDATSRRRRTFPFEEAAGRISAGMMTPYSCPR